MSKEFRVGLIALIAGVLLYYGFNYLKGTDVLTQTNRFYVVYDHINGLASGSPVNIKGMQVGRVAWLNFDQSTGRIVVAMDLQGDITLGDSTIAELSSAGFLGGEVIILSEKINRDYFSPGDTLIAKVDPGLSEIIDSAKPITDNIQVTVRRINEILLGMEGFGESLRSVVGNLDTVLVDVKNVLQENDEKISTTFSRIDTLIMTMNSAVEPIEGILRNLEEVSNTVKDAELQQTIASTNTLLANLNTTLDSLTNSQGTIGKLISEDSLYQNLNQTLVDLDKLLIHLNNYPRDFMSPLGRKNRRLEGLPEEE